jgi:hypothetical protein
MDQWFDETPPAIRAIVVMFLMAIVHAVLFVFLQRSEEKSAISKSAQDDLEREFKSIKQLPSAFDQKHHAWHKQDHASVGSSFSTGQSDSEVKKYYAEELSKHGWKSRGDYSTTNWGSNLGGSVVEYCKGKYEATLEYAGERVCGRAGELRVGICPGVELGAKVASRRSGGQPVPIMPNPSFKRTVPMLGPSAVFSSGVWHRARRLTLRWAS